MTPTARRSAWLSVERGDQVVETLVPVEACSSYCVPDRDHCIHTRRCSAIGLSDDADSSKACLAAGRALRPTYGYTNILDSVEAGSSYCVPDRDHCIHTRRCSVIGLPDDADSSKARLAVGRERRPSCGDVLVSLELGSSYCVGPRPTLRVRGRLRDRAGTYPHPLTLTPMSTQRL